MADICIETYGCSNNIAESQIMGNILTKKGHRLSSFQDSDVVIVNTCSVKSVTENRIIHRIKSIQIEHPEKKLIIAGCMPESEYDILKEIAPSACLMSTHHLDEVAFMVESALADEYVEVLGKAKLDKASMKKQRTNPLIDIIPISSGCRSFCAFCATKMAKGDLFSYPESNIISAVRNSVSEGAREFWITSQDNGCYGFDRGTDIARLLKNITERVEGDYMLRNGMMNPEHVKKILPQLIEAYKNGRVFKFLHLPVQSGSDAVLKNMRRKYSVRDFIDIIEAFRFEMPSITIWTDIIAGFPEETDQDFEESLQLVKELQFDFVNVSAYGNRPNTPASRMKQIPTDVKKERTRAMSELVEKTCKKANEKWKGWNGPVLIDEYNFGKKNWIGRNYAYKPVVLSEEKFALGQDVGVTIKDATSKCLFGEAIKNIKPHIKG
jgi:MiaB-like tRNA modifying enzyme